MWLTVLMLFKRLAQYLRDVALFLTKLNRLTLDIPSVSLGQGLQSMVGKWLVFNSERAEFLDSWRGHPPRIIERICESD
jgi:hypothetical protein